MTPKETYKEIIDLIIHTPIERNGVLYSGVKKDIAVHVVDLVLQEVLKHMTNIDDIIKIAEIKNQAA
jgi:hypothetical protein